MKKPILVLIVILFVMSCAPEPRAPVVPVQPAAPPPVYEPPVPPAQPPAEPAQAVPTAEKPPAAETPAPKPRLHEVQIKAYTYIGKNVEINAGDTVLWTNYDKTVHTITGETFTSEDLRNGDQYNRTFKVPGRYDYGCKYHPQMAGVIVVK